MQCATMVASSMPDQGWMEITIENMMDRVGTLQTELGEVTIQCRVRLPQGKGRSVIACNLVCQNKIAQWTTTNPEGNMVHSEGYSFAARDPQDGRMGRRANAHKGNYSNDSGLMVHDGNQRTVMERIEANSKMCQKERHDLLKSLLELSRAAVKRTGEFSAVCKIPRQGSKSHAMVFNVHPDNTHLVPEIFDSFEYSFAQARPETTQLPVTCATKRKEPGQEMGDNAPDLATMDKATLQRQLGILFIKSGNSSATGKMLLAKARAKIRETRIPRGCGPNTCPLFASTYLTPTINWSPLMARLDSKELNKLDQ